MAMSADFQSTSDFAPDSSIDTILLHNTLKPAVRFPNDATYHLHRSDCFNAEFS